MDTGATLREFNGEHAKWYAKRESFRKAYEEAKQKTSANKQQLSQIQQIEDRIKELTTNLAKYKLSMSSLEQAESEYSKVKEKWYMLHREKADLLSTQCNKLTELSKGFLKATLKRGMITDELGGTFKEIISGTKIRGTKTDSILERIKSSPDPIIEWNGILKELEGVALYGMGICDQPEMPDTPILNELGFSAQEKEKISEKMTIDKWIQLSQISLEDLPVFQYRVREDEYIDFSDASAGQQATALLIALLNEEGPPLIVDQPEDDLDNQIILDIVEQIWKAKEMRQLIFSSHNANIVVNGDAELVICCDYKAMVDHSGGQIKALGAIDAKEIKKEITMVMEGGEKAFQLRREKYGF
jgi:chromosome segregation protein